MSMFGANFGNPALNLAYDQMVLEDIEKQEARRAVRRASQYGIYADESVYDDEEEERR